MTPKFKLTVFSESWMVFYGTEICFKRLLKVSILAEIFDPRQKFLLNCLRWSKCIWSQNLDFHGVPPRLVEISGKQNWANVGNLDHFAQNTKKTTNVEKWCFLTFLKMGVLWKNFDTQLQNFKYGAHDRRNFCRPQNFGDHKFRS